MTGEGQIIFGDRVTMGVYKSPHFWLGYSYLESRNSASCIRIGDNTVLNNGFVAVSAGSSITIGENCVFGTNCIIFDSDFHRVGQNSNQIKTREVIIGDNVFVGSDVKILKGVTIGDHCVIAAGATVTKSFPSNTVVGGNPATGLKYL
jgi:acetyltransferase-like isoleucine patch superfamily enzyme